MLLVIARPPGHQNEHQQRAEKEMVEDDPRATFPEFPCLLLLNFM